MTYQKRNVLGHKGDRMRSDDFAKRVSIQRCGVRKCEAEATLSIPTGEGLYKHRCYDHLGK